MAEKLRPASGAIGEAVQCRIQRFGPGSIGAEGVQFRLVQVASFAKRVGPDDRVGQRAPRLTIELEQDPSGSATRSKARYPGHESSGSRTPVGRS